MTSRPDKRPEPRFDWFIPIDGDGEHIGTSRAERHPTFEYLREVVETASENRLAFSTPRPGIVHHIAGQLPPLVRMGRSMGRRHLNLGLLLLALSLLVACTGGPTPTSTATPNLEGAYLEGLAEATQGLDEVFQTFDELLGPVFPRFAPDEIQARIMFNALEEAKFSESTADRVQIFESLSPPERFAGDHAVFLRSLRGQVSLATTVDDAVQRRDLPHVHLAMAELQAAFGVVRFAVSPEFCRYITPDRPSGIGPGADTNLRELYCSDEPIPGGEYGAAITRLAETFNVEFMVRANFPPGMTEEELLEGLTYVQPAIVELFNETLAGLDAIEPPPEYQVGHQVLHDYFSELLSTARAIDRAVADGDNDQVQREFDRSGQIARTADGRLPESYRPLVKAIFR